MFYTCVHAFMHLFVHNQILPREECRDHCSGKASANSFVWARPEFSGNAKNCYCKVLAIHPIQLYSFPFLEFIKLCTSMCSLLSQNSILIFFDLYEEILPGRRTDGRIKRTKLEWIPPLSVEHMSLFFSFQQPLFPHDFD